jgi:hypothetical protein
MPARFERYINCFKEDKMLNRGGAMYCRYSWNKYNYHWSHAVGEWCNYTFHWCDGDYIHGRYDAEQ